MPVKTIYLDTCCLQRPLDNQMQARIRVETEAVLAILVSVQMGELNMLSSDALEYEINRIPDSQRKSETQSLLSLASKRLVISQSIEDMAENFEKQGISPMDAIHLAIASEYKADFFVTTDDSLLNKAKQIKLSCNVVSILEFLQEIDP